MFETIDADGPGDEIVEPADERHPNEVEKNNWVCLKPDIVKPKMGAAHLKL